MVDDESEINHRKSTFFVLVFHLLFIGDIRCVCDTNPINKFNDTQNKLTLLNVVSCGSSCFDDRVSIYIKSKKNDNLKMKINTKNTP